MTPEDFERGRAEGLAMWNGLRWQLADALQEVECLRHAMQDADKMADDPTTARAILRAALHGSMSDA